LLDWTATATRFLVFAATLTLFGASAFFGYGMTPPDSDKNNCARKWTKIALMIVAATALMASVLWLMSEAAMLSGQSADALNVAAVWSVVTDTHFGRVGALRCVVLAVILLGLTTLGLCGQRIWVLRSVLAGAVVSSLAWTGHGNIDSGPLGWVHVGSDSLHLLTAGLWVGALVPLCVLAVDALRRGTAASEDALAFGLVRFSSIGVPVVAILLLSGVINSWFLIGPAAWRSVVTTLYGRLLLAKLVLFVLMVTLAACNRVRLTPALQGAVSAMQPRLALRRLRASLVTETVLAMLVLGLVALIGTLEPPISK
jgi:putative copper resistance protein D